MSVVVVVTWDGAGNFPPERALVRELVARGHDVHVLAFNSQAEAVRADGAAFHALEGVEQLNSTDRSANRDRAWMIENVAMAPGYGACLAKALESLRPDIVLADFVLASALTTGVSSGLPTVALGHSIYSPVGASPLGPVIDACALVCIFSFREFDPAPAFSDRHRFFTPYKERVARRTTSGPRQAVLVSLSTSSQDQGSLIQRLCEAAASIDANFLVTTGGAYEPNEFSSAPNTKITRFAPHDEVLPSTDLLVTHAGHGTVIAGARHGTPMLCIPMGRDQPYVASQAERLGLCKVASPEDSVRELHVAMRNALADQSMRRRSEVFAAVAAQAPDLSEAAAAVEELLSS